MGAKSNADDTLYERWWRARARAAASSTASSTWSRVLSSEDRFRDDGVPKMDDSCELRREACDDDASEASSRESREGGGGIMRRGRDSPWRCEVSCGVPWARLGTAVALGIVVQEYLRLFPPPRWVLVVGGRKGESLESCG